VTLLVRVDPQHGVNRWYCVTVQPTLFDGCTVVCAWGSRQTAYQRMRILSAGSPEAARELLAEIVARKLKRGYVVGRPLE